jgi:hypothetical protein
VPKSQVSSPAHVSKSHHGCKVGSQLLSLEKPSKCGLNSLKLVIVKLDPMYRENRPLVTYEPVELEK